LLESHELANIMNMDVESDEEEEEDMGEEVQVPMSQSQPLAVNEYEEMQRPHAGTGGSSRMRSRPSNQGPSSGLRGSGQMIQQ